LKSYPRLPAKRSASRLREMPQLRKRRHAFWLVTTCAWRNRSRSVRRRNTIAGLAAEACQFQMRQRLRYGDQRHFAPGVLFRRLARSRFGSTRRRCGSIHHQIILASQYALDVDCGAGRSIGICSARGQHTQRPVILSSLICNAVDGDFLNVMTAVLLSDFC
jgi:hypothetical protein